MPDISEFFTHTGAPHLTSPPYLAFQNLVPLNSNRRNCHYNMLFITLSANVLPLQIGTTTVKWISQNLLGRSVLPLHAPSYIQTLQLTCNVFIVYTVDGQVEYSYDQKVAFFACEYSKRPFSFWYPYFLFILWFTNIILVDEIGLRYLQRDTSLKCDENRQFWEIRVMIIDNVWWIWLTAPISSTTNSHYNYLYLT